MFALDSARLVAQYGQTGYECPVTSISFHPFDHSVAFASLGANQPVLVYTWDETVPSLAPLMNSESGAPDNLNNDDLDNQPLFNVPATPDAEFTNQTALMKHRQLLLLTAQHADGGGGARSLPLPPAQTTELRSLSGATTTVAARSAHT